jgi:hypothetical protein
MSDTKRWSPLLTLLVVLILSGCTTLGPPTVARDRFDYVEAISSSWKSQTLLNLVKTRYADAPVFMDVTSVINQYSLEGQLQLEASWSNPPYATSQNIGGSAKYADRPTITYAPLTGEKFAKNLLTPVPVPGILFLLQSGYSADYIFRMCVHTVNGIENRYGSSLSAREADQRFPELIDALSKLQRAGGLGMRVTPIDDKQAFVMFFRPMTNPVILEELSKIKEILGLNPDSREFVVSYGAFSSSDHEIAILSRSILQIMIDIASTIEVPKSDVAEGRVYATSKRFSESDEQLPPLVNVRYSDNEPSDSYVKIPYRGRWFWIDDRDYPSKRVFSFLMLLFALTETGTQGITPIITVPTN